VDGHVFGPLSWVVTITATPLTHKIHDRSLSWVITIAAIPLTLKYMTVHFPGLLQSCDCNNPGKWTVMYLCVRGIDGVVTTQESERSCILCVRGIAVIVTTQESGRSCI
jgi:hypothetical protein